MMQERSWKLITGLFTLALALALPVATVTWAKGKKAELTGPEKAGQKLFEENCSMCHFPDQAKNKIGPGLKEVFKNKELPYSHRPATVANVKEQIEKGNPQGKPMPMPPFASKLSASDLNNLIAYLKTL
jgi:mono/diheme cytochrome c family protein